MGNDGSKVLVEPYGRRQRKALVTGRRPVEQRHMDGRKPRSDWQVNVHHTRKVLSDFGAVGVKTALVLYRTAERNRVQERKLELCEVSTFENPVKFSE